MYVGGLCQTGQSNFECTLSLVFHPLSHPPNVDFTMSKASQPELKKVGLYRLLTIISFTLYLLQFMDKKLFVHLQGGRKVSGVLRGYDLFLNLVLDDCLEESTAAQKFPIGTVVSLELATKIESSKLSFQVIRGNSITSMETLEAVRS